MFKIGFTEMQVSFTGKSKLIVGVNASVTGRLSLFALQQTGGCILPLAIRPLAQPPVHHDLRLDKWKKVEGCVPVLMNTMWKEEKLKVGVW